MKLINSFGPNPRVVRMFLLEKGLEIETQEIDILAGDNFKADYLKKNPTGLSPALELDDGTVIGETVAICEFLEELHPLPAVIGKSSEERAKSRMWYRRVELYITEHMYNAFRYGEGYDRFKDLIYCIPEAAESLKAKARERREWLNGLMDGRDFIAGDTVTLADIILYCCLDFLKDVGQPVDEDLANLNAWYQRMSQRPTAAKSLHPQRDAVGWNG